MRKVIITLEIDQSIENINKVMERMLWDSEHSYEFENADWEISYNEYEPSTEP
jgi:hypothetical protein